MVLSITELLEYLVKLLFQRKMNNNASGKDSMEGKLMESLVSWPDMFIG